MKCTHVYSGMNVTICFGGQFLTGIVNTGMREASLITRYCLLRNFEYMQSKSRACDCRGETVLRP